jgi:hypothetical protein
VHKVKSIALALLFAGAVAAGAGYTNQVIAMKDKTMKAAAAEMGPSVARAELGQKDLGRSETGLQPADRGRMTVAGRVLDPSGKPVKGAAVDLVARSRTVPRDRGNGDRWYTVLGQGSTDDLGQFRLETARTSSSGHFDLRAVAFAPGYGLGWMELNPDAEQPVAELRLRAEQTVHVRLVDISGNPARNVEVLARSMGHTTNAGIWEGISLWRTPPRGLRAWPPAATSDADGKLVLTGIPRDHAVDVIVGDARYARQERNIDASKSAVSSEITLTLDPAFSIEGRVVTADTGRPIADAVVSVKASRGPFGGMFESSCRSDDEGRFRISPHAGDYFRVRAVPAQGQPYLESGQEFTWTKGAVKKAIELKLTHGALLQGNVIDEATGRPVAGAALRSLPKKRSVETEAMSEHDGSFRLAVPPGEGYLFVLGPTLDFVPKQISSAKLHELYGAEMRHYAHAIVEYDVKRGEAPHAVSIYLRPSKTVRGRLVGPGGQTAQDAVVLTRQQIEPNNLIWLNHNFIHARDGRFELPGFDTDKAAPAYFLDAEHQWGAAVEFSGKQSSSDLTVQLEPCGQARARFVGPDGKPVAKLDAWPYVHIIMTPGPDQNSRSKDDHDKLAADVAYLPNVDPKHYRTQGPQQTVTDDQGRITLPALIPGAPYRIVDWSTVNVEDKGTQIRKDFTVKPGETVDLGDILVEKPTER